jgi:hypothetical protein
MQHELRPRGKSERYRQKKGCGYQNTHFKGALTNVSARSETGLIGLARLALLGPNGKKTLPTKPLGKKPSNACLG